MLYAVYIDLFKQNNAIYACLPLGSNISEIPANTATGMPQSIEKNKIK